MQVDILGPMRVRVDDRETDLGGPRNRALIARLALDAGRPVSTTLLIEDLWGMNAPADAANALQSIVSRSRRRLPAGSLILSPAGYVLDASVDAAEFERLAAVGRTAEALSLWRGDALVDIDAPFVDAASSRLGEIRLGVLETHLATIVCGGADAAVVAELGELTTAHPYRDTLWLLYLRSLVDTGRPAEALTSYEAMRSMLADDLGVDPSAELQDLHLTILKGATPSRRRAAPRLPVGLTSFVGRDEAIADIGAALTDHRLVTILGPGGAGKTRLSIETARAHAGHFDDVWLVELAPVTGGDDIRTAILAAMGLLEVSVRERATPVANRPDARAKLVEALQDSRGLLILDNCEHLIDDVAAIAEELLANAGQLKVLATSREPLRILGEFGYQLSPLAQPPAGCTPEQALTYSAVELFMQRAGAVDQSFELSVETLPGVLEICARLDGQPLAIELATARLRTLTVAQVADRLSDRFRLLTGGSRTSLPRHRTLRAVVEWSWDLLSEEERMLAERIAVFPGGVTADSARAVVDGDVADLLDSLADKSLLVPVRGSTPRFRMLETLREYGIERLIDQGIVQDVRSAHLDHFLAYAERFDPLLRDHRQLEGFAALDVERGNITAALRFAVDQDDRARAVRLTAALAWYWSTRSQHEEAATWGMAVLKLEGAADPVAEILASALGVTATFLSDESDERDSLVRRILDLYDLVETPNQLVDMVLSAIHMFDMGEGRAAPEPTDIWTRSAICLMQNVALENAGKFDGTIPMLDEAIEGFAKVGDRWGLATTLAQRGSAEAASGDFEEARESWEESVVLLEELGANEDVFLTQSRLMGLQTMQIEDADIGPFREELTAKVEEARRANAFRAEVIALLGLAALERKAGSHRLAMSCLQEVLASVDSIGAFGGGQMQATIHASLTVVEADLGDLGAARKSLQLAASIGAASKDMPVIAQVAVSSAYFAASEGQQELAAQRLGAADRIRGQVDHMNVDAKTLTERLRKGLGVEAFEASFAEGFELDQAEALDLALGQVRA